MRDRRADRRRYDGREAAVSLLRFVLTALALYLVVCGVLAALVYLVRLTVFGV